MIQSVGTAYGGSVDFMVGLIIRNVLGNVVLFLPFGLVFPILWNRRTSLYKTIISACLVSMGIELLQFFENLLFSYVLRIIDIDDVICNTFGAATGYGIYKLCVLCTQKWNISFLKKYFFDMQ